MAPDRAEGRGRLRTAFDVAASVLAVVVVATALGGRAPDYPFPGSRSTAHYVVARLRPGEAVFVPATSPYPFTLESGFPVEILPVLKACWGTCRAS